MFLPSHVPSTTMALEIFADLARVGAALRFHWH
jgi:hypothetical protein